MYKRELALSAGVRGKRVVTLLETLVEFTGLATNPPSVLAHCGKQGRRIQARSGQARMRLLGRVGTGVGSPRIRIPERTGFLEG